MSPEPLPPLPELLDAVEAVVCDLEDAGWPVIPGTLVLAEALLAEDAAAPAVRDTFYGGGPMLAPTLAGRVEGLLDRWLGYAGPGGTGMVIAARLLAEALHHDPEPRRLETPRRDFGAWPFTCIDWGAAAAELYANGAIGRDLLIVRGHVFRRAPTEWEYLGEGDDWRLA